MHVKDLRCAMHNTASALWYQNGRSTVLGSLLFVQLWIRRCFLQQVYSLRYHMCAYVRVFFFFRDLEQGNLGGR